MEITYVRSARKGEVPNFYAMDDIKEGDPVVHFLHNQIRDNLELAIIPRVLDGFQPEPTAYRHAKIAHKRTVRKGWAIGIVVLVVALGLYATLAHADTITYAPMDASTVASIPQNITIHDAIVTAYTSSVDETDNTPFITASGVHTTPGEIACPSKYPFGTQVKIHDAIYQCQDRMNVKYGDRFDVWVYTKAEADQWGKQVLDVEIIGVK